MARRKQVRLTDVKDIRSILRLTHEQGLSVRAVAVYGVEYRATAQNRRGCRATPDEDEHYVYAIAL